MKKKIAEFARRKKKKLDAAPLGLKVISAVQFILGLAILRANLDNLLEHFYPAPGYVAADGLTRIVILNTPIFQDILVMATAALFVVTSVGLFFHKEGYRNTALFVLSFASGLVIILTVPAWFSRGFVSYDVVSLLLMFWFAWCIIYLYSKKIKKYFSKRFNR
jgi:hypothetical protein